VLSLIQDPDDEYDGTEAGWMNEWVIRRCGAIHFIGSPSQSATQALNIG